MLLEGAYKSWTHIVVAAFKLAHFYDMVDITKHWLNYIPEEIALRALVHRSFGMC